MLPPTSASDTYHSLRVYLQVQQWMELDHMNPEDRGWYGQGGYYFPSLTDKDAALTDLLEMVRLTARQVAIHSGVHAGNMGLNVPLDVDTAVGCEVRLTFCWMMATKTYMMTRFKLQLCDSLKLHYCIRVMCVCAWWVYVWARGEICKTE